MLATTSPTCRLKVFEADDRHREVPSSGSRLAVASDHDGSVEGGQLQ